MTVISEFVRLCAVHHSGLDERPPRHGLFADLGGGRDGERDDGSGLYCEKGAHWATVIEIVNARNRKLVLGPVRVMRIDASVSE